MIWVWGAGIAAIFGTILIWAVRWNRVMITTVETDEKTGERAKVLPYEVLIGTVVRFYREVNLEVKPGFHNGSRVAMIRMTRKKDNPSMLDGTVHLEIEPEDQREPADLNQE